MQIEVVESVTKTIGSLALAYPYLRRLGVADIIDALTTKGKERHVSTGQVIEILVLNRLSLRPTPISKIDAWAQTQAVEEVYSLAANALKVERRFRMVKQPPIQVRPVWLHQPQRIESLVFVVMVALFVFALIEREARRVVKESGQVFTGLRPEGRDKLPVTAGRLFEAFAPLSLVKQRMRVAGEVIDVLTPATLSPIQAQVLDRLGLMKPVSYLQPTITPHPT